jgi:hypothetical protein
MLHTRDTTEGKIAQMWRGDVDQRQDAHFVYSSGGVGLRIKSFPYHLGLGNLRWSTQSTLGSLKLHILAPSMQFAGLHDHIFHFPSICSPPDVLNFFYISGTPS